MVENMKRTVGSESFKWPPGCWTSEKDDTSEASHSILITSIKTSSGGGGGGGRVSEWPALCCWAIKDSTVVVVWTLDKEKFQKGTQLRSSFCRV